MIRETYRGRELTARRRPKDLHTFAARVLREETS